MRYKQSIYNMYIGKSESQESILFNTFTTSLITLDQHLIELIDTGELDLDKIASNDCDNIKSLIENGFLVESNLDEITNIKILGEKEKYRQDSELTITIAPTMGCNMCCPYCFQSEEIMSTVMSFETCDRIVDFISSKLDNRPYLQVSWFGGEPLLAIPQIKYISKKLIELCNQKDIPYYSDIITNGYNLTLENAKILKEECNIVSAQITIDGVEEYHNSKRILKNGNKSFRTIVDNIKAIADDMTIVVRVNVDKENSDKLIELIDYLLIQEKLKGKIKLSLSPVFDLEYKKDKKYNGYCSKDNWNTHSLNALKHYLTIDDIDNIGTAFIQSSVVCCGASVYDSLIFDSDGDMYKCYLSIGRKKDSIGNIHDYVDNKELINNKNHYKWLSGSFSEDCKECVYIPICHSGCLFNRFESDKSQICLMSKAVVKDIVLETYNYYEKHNIVE